MVDGDRSVARPEEELRSEDCEWSGYQKSLNAYTGLTESHWCIVSQTPGRGPVPGPGINYTGPREVLLEFVILIF